MITGGIVSILPPVLTPGALAAGGEHASSSKEVKVLAGVESGE